MLLSLAKAVAAVPGPMQLHQPGVLLLSYKCVTGLIVYYMQSSVCLFE
jgi:hypothetical protein